MSLWSIKAPAKWQQQLDEYHETVAGLGRTSKEGKPLKDLDRRGYGWLPHVQLKDRFASSPCKMLDRWFLEELPASLDGRKPCQISKEELVKLVDWKLTRGKWRPRLLDFAKTLDAGAAEAASQAAFDLLAPHKGAAAPAGAIKEALDALCVLKGVGPATASAVLEAYDPSIPFLSDEAQHAAVGSKDYTVKSVQQLAAALRGKATELSKAGDRQWTAKEVEMCLFASAVGASASGDSKASRKGSGKSKAAGGKTKASGAAAPAGVAEQGGSRKKQKS